MATMATATTGGGNGAGQPTPTCWEEGQGHQLPWRSHRDDDLGAAAPKSGKEVRRPRLPLEHSDAEAAQELPNFKPAGAGGLLRAPGRHGPARVRALLSGSGLIFGTLL